MTVKYIRIRARDARHNYVRPIKGSCRGSSAPELPNSRLSNKNNMSCGRDIKRSHIHCRRKYKL